MHVGVKYENIKRNNYDAEICLNSFFVQAQIQIKGVFFYCTINPSNNSLEIKWENPKAIQNLCLVNLILKFKDVHI